MTMNIEGVKRMERIAILSDVHGNITALENVIADIEKRGISKIYCLGDSVIKCANPDKVIDLLRAKCEVMLLGNCDEIICRPNVESGRFWSRDKIGEERANFIYHLPISYEFTMSGHLIRLFHASPISLEHIFNPMFPNSDSIYFNKIISNPNDLFLNTEFIGKTEKDPVPDIVGYGHLHTPNLYRFGNKTIFNVGSVGVPVEMINEGEENATSKYSTMSSYMILEGELESKELSAISFTLVRLPYDIEKEIAYLEESDMPNKEIIIASLKTANH